MSQHGPAATAQPEIKRGDIAIMLSTRGRPDMLLEVFESLRATTARKDKVALWLYVDEDDQVTRAAIDGGKFPELGFPVHWHIGPRTPDWGQTYQVLWTTEPASAPWTPLGIPIPWRGTTNLVPGNGATNTVLDSTYGRDRRLYRVIEVP